MRGMSDWNPMTGRTETYIEKRYRSQRRVTRFYDSKGKVAGTMSVSMPAKRSGPLKKRTPYNYKQLSGQLMRARTSGNVSQVLTKMRAKRMQLVDAKRNSDYDETEIAIAIIHAEAIERVAKKRKRNLQMEEKAAIDEKNQEFEERLEEAADPLGLSDSGEDENSRTLTEEELERMMADIEEEMERLMKEMEENAKMDEALEEMTEFLSDDISPEDLEAAKKKHRSEEQRDIVKADMKYLKALFDKLSRDKADAAAGKHAPAGAFADSAPAVSIGLKNTGCADAAASRQDVAGQSAATSDAAALGNSSIDIQI